MDYSFISIKFKVFICIYVLLFYSSTSSLSTKFDYLKSQIRNNLNINLFKSTTTNVHNISKLPTDRLLLKLIIPIFTAIVPFNAISMPMVSIKL